MLPKNGLIFWDGGLEPSQPESATIDRKASAKCAKDSVLEPQMTKGSFLGSTDSWTVQMRLNQSRNRIVRESQYMSTGEALSKRRACVLLKEMIGGFHDVWSRSMKMSDPRSPTPNRIKTKAADE